MAAASGIKNNPVSMGLKPRTFCKNTGSKNSAENNIKVDTR